jgi:hypothetical protein
MLDHEADAERQEDLRYDRDVERALGVAGALEAAGIGQGRGDEEAGDAEDPQQSYWLGL